MKSKQVLGSILLALSASIWGGMFVVVKSIVNQIPPIELVWLRYLTAIVCLLGIAAITKSHWRFNWHDLKIIILIGILGNTISLITQETGTWLSNAQTGAVITTITPTFMIIFAWLLLKERLNRVRQLSVVIATLGVITIVGIHLSGAHLLLGIASLLISSMFWALASVMVKKLSGNYTVLQLTIISITVALICITPWIIFHWGTIENVNFVNLKVIFCILYLGCVSTAAAYLMWNRGLELLDADSSGLFYLIQPIVGAILGWLLLGEQISVGFLIGTCLIIGGVFIYIRFDR